MKIENRIPVPHLSRWIRGVIVFLILVILWGAYVRSTGSGAGCGSHWPLCNGQIIPMEPSLKTMVEFFHRITSGISLALVLWTGLRIFRAFPKGKFIRKMATIAMISILMEAIIGAGLVLFELVSHDQSIKRVISIALHFINTLILLGALSLAYASTFRRGNKFSWQLQGLKKPAYLFTAFFFVLGMAGAVTALGDTLFPSQSLLQGIHQDWNPESHFLIKLRVIHPILAILFILFTIPWILSKRASCTSNQAKKLGVQTTALLSANFILGILNLLWLAPILLQILHLLVALCIWISWILLLDSLTADRAFVARSQEISKK